MNDAASAPFAITGLAAIIGAGLLAAAIAHQPARLLVWAVAYLVLIAGVAQYALGVGQARLSTRAPSRGTVWGQWVLLNLGHAGIIGGTLAARSGPVAVATVAYLAALAWLALRVRPDNHRKALIGYRALVLVLAASSLLGVTLERGLH